jgi:hypothetical protein
MCKRDIEVHSRNHCYCVIRISISYYECVAVAFGIQKAKRKPRIILSPVSCPVLPDISKLSHKQHNFRENDTEHRKRVLIFSTNFV